jgi:hypothetical protein
VYGAAKAAAVQFTRSLAGGQCRRDVALASDPFRFVTGEEVPTDGGTGVAGGRFFDDHRRTFVNRPDGLTG